MIEKMVDAKLLYNALSDAGGCDAKDSWSQGWDAAITEAIDILYRSPVFDAVKLPCKIGDTVWFAKQYKCHKHPRKGVVSEMFFMDDMSLQIVVKSVGRGKWGEMIFATYEEAQAAIERREAK